MEALKRVRTFIKKKFRNGEDFIRKVTMTSVILNMFHFQIEKISFGKIGNV